MSRATRSASTAAKTRSAALLIAISSHAPAPEPAGRPGPSIARPGRRLQPSRREATPGSASRRDNMIELVGMMWVRRPGREGARWGRLARGRPAPPGPCPRAHPPGGAVSSSDGQSLPAGAGGAAWTGEKGAMHRSIAARGWPGSRCWPRALLLLPAAPVGAQAAVAVAATATPGVVEVMRHRLRRRRGRQHLADRPERAGPGRREPGRRRRRRRQLHAAHPAPLRGRPLGDHRPRARQRRGGDRQFERPARGPDLTLSVSPASGPAGTTFAFAATGFDGRQEGQLLADRAGRHDVRGRRRRRDSDGAVSFSYTVEAGTQAGTWTMSAYGQSATTWPWPALSSSERARAPTRSCPAHASPGRRPGASPVGQDGAGGGASRGGPVLPGRRQVKGGAAR